MYADFQNIYTFLEIKDSKEYSCPFIKGYSRNILFQNSLGTLKSYIPFIHKFWLYSLYFPANNESFVDYMWRYREVVATKGFKIKKQENINNQEIEYLSVQFKPTNSIKSDMIALKSYFLYIFDELNNENFDLLEKIPIGAYGNALNYNTLKNSEKYSSHSSYGLKARGIMRDALAVNITIFDKLIKSRKYTNKENSIEKSLINSEMNEVGKVKMKNFPLYAFNDFIASIKSPRDKLLYLLCGCLGARKAQALNLTFYDIDVKNQIVYLTDPETNNKPVNKYGKVHMEQIGRKDLLKKYGIYPDIKPHSLIRFKYPIPSITEKGRELKFLPGYKDIFFKTYSRVLQTINTKNNPFIFQTNTGRRYLPSNASTLFNNNLKKFQLNNNQYDSFELEGDLHTFRHMYGVVWADIAHYLDEIMRAEALKKDKKVIDVTGVIKNVIAKKMGINSDAINVYFNRSEYTRNQIEILMDIFGEDMLGLYKYAEKLNKKIIVID